MKKLIGFLIFLALSIVDVNAQCETCPPNTICDSESGRCISSNPPPPGLPVSIDSNLKFLFVGGLFIGGFFCYKRGLLR